MPAKYFWAQLVSRIFYCAAVLSLLGFIIISGSSKAPVWELLASAASCAVVGLFWEILCDIGQRLNRIESEQVFSRRWSQKPDDK